MKKIRNILIALIFVFLFAATGVLYLKNQTSPVSKKQESEKIRIEIPSGMSVTGISGLLKENNLIKNDKFFYYAVRFPVLLKFICHDFSESAVPVLKSGIYFVSPDMNYWEIIQLLSSGQTEYIKISIPEGFTISKIGSILENNKVCSLADFKAASRNRMLLSEYKIPETAENCEGYLFPDTYFLNSGMNAETVVRIMLDNFFTKIAAVENLSSKNPAELHEIVKLASVVEREYRIDEEAPLIASVFKNRLRYNIGLYSCATVEYIITEIQGKPHPDRILIEDTKIDSPYNTYKYAGLPPGPISNPGFVAINAATNTPKTNYYYFQIQNVNEGRHVFSETFEEHKMNHTSYTKKVQG